MDFLALLVPHVLLRANDYLTKPFELLEVKARVRSLLKAKAYSDAVKEKIASELRIARDTLVIYTDGVTEAANEGDDLFGDKRLLAHLAAEPGRTAAETVSGLVGAVRRFVGNREPADDIGILALRRRA